VICARSACVPCGALGSDPSLVVGLSVIETQGCLQAGFRCQMIGLIVEVPVGRGEDAVMPGHRRLAALPSRSVNLRFFSSQYSGVTEIG